MIILRNTPLRLVLLPSINLICIYLNCNLVPSQKIIINKYIFKCFIKLVNYILDLFKKTQT